MNTYIVQGFPLTPVKIGKAEDVERRITQIQTGHYTRLRVLLVLDGDHERELHERFSEYRLVGEWFMWSEKIEKFIFESLSEQSEQCTVWHTVNIYCSPEQRSQFNEWRYDMYKQADSLRDFVNRMALVKDFEIPKEIGAILKKISEVPYLMY